MKRIVTILLLLALIALLIILAKGEARGKISVAGLLSEIIGAWFLSKAMIHEEIRKRLLPAMWTENFKFFTWFDKIIIQLAPFIYPHDGNPNINPGDMEGRTEAFRRMWCGKNAIVGFALLSLGALLQIAAYLI